MFLRSLRLLLAPIKGIGGLIRVFFILLIKQLCCPFIQMKLFGTKRLPFRRQPLIISFEMFFTIPGIRTLLHLPILRNLKQPKNSGDSDPLQKLPTVFHQKKVSHRCHYPKKKRNVVRSHHFQ